MIRKMNYLPCVHLLLSVMSSNLVCGSYNIKKHREVFEAGEANKLYATRPTSGSFNNDPYSKAGQQRSKLLAGGANGNVNDSINDELPAPYFDVNYSKNVTGVCCKTALLSCRVKNIGNNIVSWLRYDDTRMLTIGPLTFTSDMRFKAIHKLYSEDYLLQIKPTTHRDSGKYACQISTTPPKSHIVTLTLAEPKTAILGGPDIHLKEGNTMNLTCIITDSPEPPSYIFWRHNDAIIYFDSPRGGVNIIIEKGDYYYVYLPIWTNSQSKGL